MEFGGGVGGGTPQISILHVQLNTFLINLSLEKS